jgi:hypothetical protein
MHPGDRVRVFLNSDKTLVIPSSDGSSDGTIPNDARASSEFKEKNILVGDSLFD